MACRGLKLFFSLFLFEIALLTSGSQMISSAGVYSRAESGTVCFCSHRDSMMGVHYEALLSVCIKLCCCYSTRRAISFSHDTLTAVCRSSIADRLHLFGMCFGPD